MNALLVNLGPSQCIVVVSNIRQQASFDCKRLSKSSTQLCAAP